MNIKRALITILAMVIILHITNSSFILSRSIGDHKKNKYIYLMNEISDDLFTAVASYGFERGRVNVVLNDAGNPNGMEENRLFISEKRSAGEEALLNAFSKLASVSMADDGAAIDRIKEIRKDVINLRDLASRDLVISLDERDAKLPEIWFSKMTEYIESIESLLVIISQDISDSDGLISRYSSMKHKTLSLRNTAGPEISILSATMLSEKPIKPNLSEDIITRQIVSNEMFKELDLLSLPLKGSPVYTSLQNLKKTYSGDYVKYRDKVFPLAHEGGPYPFSQKEFLSLGVNFLNQIAVFMNTIVQQNKEYTSQKLRDSKKEIIKDSLFVSLSLFLLVMFFYIVNSRIINPIQKVTEKILLLGENKTDVIIPYLGSQDEIGNMARAVEVFKKTLLTLDKNVLDLENISNERARLIVKLQKTLEEVRKLREIIPICSYCKNIRNDQGYYEEVWTYFSKYSDADFSHTICPDCLKKYHPEIAEEVERE
jgi:hypothetical protein